MILAATFVFLGMASAEPGPCQNGSAVFQLMKEQSPLVAELTRVTDGKKVVKLVACTPKPGTSDDDERFQWLLKTDEKKLLGSLEVGFEGCCGGRWVNKPTLVVRDQDGDGSPEYYLAGAWEDMGEDGGIKGKGTLIVLSLQPGNVRRSGDCAPQTRLDRIGAAVFVAERGDYGCFSEDCSFPGLEAVDAKVSGTVDAKAKRLVVSQTWTAPKQKPIRTRYRVRWDAKKRVLTRECDAKRR
jgi:hypothetical protein